MTIWFRHSNKNSYSIAALMPLVDAGLASEPRAGIMLYSFATPQAEKVYQEVDGAREANLDAIFVAGGPHPSALPEEVLEHFDFVVVGEGEETLPELIRAITDGRDPRLVKGIAYKSAGRICFTEKRAPVDLDLYPPFSRILAPIEISRGCPWGCTYCQTPRLFGRCMRHRSIPVICRFAHRHKDIRFTSPNALAYGSDGRRPRLDKVKKLLQELSEQKKPIYFGTFPSEVRPDFVTDESLEIVTEYCANKTISLGGQSGSPAVLKSICRGHGRQEIESACELSWDHGLIPNVDLIFGLPMESAEDQQMTLDLAKWIEGKGGNVRAHRFLPLPGTPLWKSTPAPLSRDAEALLGRLALKGRLTGTWRGKIEAEKDKIA